MFFFVLFFFFFFQAEDGIRDVAVTGVQTCALPICRENGINMPKSHFDLIRKWASDRGLYKKGDPKTQALKLVEEVGETCRAILKGNQSDIEDGIGDAVVVLTNLAHLCDTDIEYRSEEHTSELQSRLHLVCRLLLEKKKKRHH